MVRDPAVRRRVLADMVRFFAASGLAPCGVCASPITGAKGNVEYFLWGKRGILEDMAADAAERMVGDAIAEAEAL